MTRYDLPFVVAAEAGGIASHWSVPHDPVGLWAEGLDVGRGHFAAVAKLAEMDELEAAIAMTCPMNSGNGWKTEGWGIEEGFSRAMAGAAIVGLRAIRAGLAEPFDVRAEMRRAWAEQDAS